jgi:anion-transporting  ArsA/GET3 family ATPase
MMNPVMEALLLTRTSERLQALRYEPPRSWTKEAKLRFLDLPANLQVYLVSREKQRDDEVRRSQNEAAEARKALAVAQQQLAEARQELAALKQAKETENGTTQDTRQTTA